MNPTQALRLALKSLAGSKLRALLTMLGIIIGVASVIVLVSIMQGMSRNMLEEFTKMGTNRLTVEVWNGASSTREVGVEDMTNIYLAHQGLFSSMSPQVEISAGISVGTTRYPSTKIRGVSEQYSRVEKMELQEGRFITYMDVKERSKVAVIGPYLAKMGYGGKALGESLKINGDLYTIVGVLTQKGNGEKGSGDDVLLLPYSSVRQFGGDLSTFVFTTTDASQNNAGKEVIRKALMEVFQTEDAFYIMDNQEIVNSVNEMNNLLTSVLVGVASISLLVGGIGIMNIMLVSVTERTREIGIRKSLGAKERDVLGQFIIESAVTSTVGGMIGIGLGVLGALIAGRVMGMAVMPSPDAIFISFGISAAIGVFFGFMPAQKAARMNPIDALKYD